MSVKPKKELIEKLTWGPKAAPFRVQHDPFVSFSGVVAGRRRGVMVEGET